jgi:aspartate ammonia-lyase
MELQYYGKMFCNFLQKVLAKNSDYDIINPLIHVNMSQSTNDVFPTAINLALIIRLNLLFNELNAIKEMLLLKSQETNSMVNVLMLMRLY